jgi:hypothetical protein
MASKFITGFYKISIIICYIFIQRSVKYFLFYTIVTLHWYFFQLREVFISTFICSRLFHSSAKQKETSLLKPILSGLYTYEKQLDHRMKNN